MGVSCFQRKKRKWMRYILPKFKTFMNNANVATEGKQVKRWWLCWCVFTESFYTKHKVILFIFSTNCDFLDLQNHLLNGQTSNALSMVQFKMDQICVCLSPLTTLPFLSDLVIYFWNELWAFSVMCCGQTAMQTCVVESVGKRQTREDTQSTLRSGYQLYCNPVE